MTRTCLTILLRGSQIPVQECGYLDMLSRIVRLLVEKAVVSPTDLEVCRRADGTERLPLDLRPEPAERRQDASA